MKKQVSIALLLLAISGNSIAQSTAGQQESQSTLTRKQELVNTRSREVDSLEHIIRQLEHQSAPDKDIRKTKKELRKAQQQLLKAERDLKREQEKSASDAWDAVAFEQAIQAIDARQFVLEAEQIVFKKGESVYVTSTTNFILLDQEEATVQTSFSEVYPGPNGLGGITLDGHISNLKKETDKKGNTTLSFNIQGVGISASIRVKLAQGNPRATAYIEPNFNSNSLTLYGRIVPLDQSEVFKGRAL